MMSSELYPKTDSTLLDLTLGLLVLYYLYRINTIRIQLLIFFTQLFALGDALEDMLAHS